MWKLFLLALACITFATAARAQQASYNWTVGDGRWLHPHLEASNYAPDIRLPDFQPDPPKTLNFVGKSFVLKSSDKMTITPFFRYEASESPTALFGVVRTESLISGAHWNLGNVTLTTVASASRFWSNNQVQGNDSHQILSYPIFGASSFQMQMLHWNDRSVYALAIGVIKPF